MKYIDESGRVRTLIAERYPFKGVDNYFTDSLLYWDSVEINESRNQRSQTLVMKLTPSQRKKSACGN